MTRQEYARIKLVCHDNPGIRFIIFKQHIITRLKFLDHRILEVERILFGRHDDIRHIGYGPHEQVGAETVMRAVEIRRHAALQVLGLTYINNLSLGVIVSIDAGGIRQERYFFF